MNSIKLFTAAIAVGLIGTMASADLKRVNKKETFLSIYVGRTMVDTNGNAYQMNADGTFSGKLSDGRTLRGAWEWRGRFWCRNAIIDGREIGSDCQKIETDGTNWRTTRKKGRGESVSGTFK